MKIKRCRTKMLLEKTRPGIKREFFDSIQNLSEYSFKEKKINSERKLVANNSIDEQQNKILKNRISAQISRDKKQKVLNEIKNQNLNLTKENINLKELLVNKEKELDTLKHKLGNLCNNCSSIFHQTPSFSTIDNKAITFNTGKSCIKYGLITSFMVVMCLMCVLSDYGLESNNPLESKIRTNILYPKRKLNSYFNRKYSCAKDNSTEYETPTNIIYEYFIQNISKVEIEPRNGTYNFTYYHSFKFNIRHFLSNFNKRKNSTFINNYCVNNRYLNK
jgi:hypothetical protein